MMLEPMKRDDKCPVCHGKGYLRCDCWPGDCICAYGDECCDNCDGTGYIGDDAYPIDDDDYPTSPKAAELTNPLSRPLYVVKGWGERRRRIREKASAGSWPQC